MLRRKIFLNTIINSGGKLLSFALQLFIITYLIKVLGKDSYGIVVLALALVANTNILEAGFGLSVTKYVAEYKAKGDWLRLLQTINTNLVISTLLGIVMSVILAVINEFFLEKIFTIPSGLVSDARNMIRALIVLSFAEFWSVSLIRVAEGFQKYTLARSMEL
ncbi:MAG: oligosaccharide flippase family protein, partial [Nitrospirota bacterium]